MANNKIEFKLIKSDYENSTCTNLLDYIEQQQLDVHFHCRDGFCGACRTKLIAGEIEYAKDPLAFVKKGDFLPCCSYPESDLVIEASQAVKT